MMNPATIQIPRPQAMREARHRLRLTQQVLARRVGCTESMITKIETGRATPATWLKVAIARELGIASWEVGS
jgi:DNA-binding XRE family transcriptional regulator